MNSSETRVKTTTPAANGKRTIRVDYLARVEGEGSLQVKIRNNEVVDCKLGIFEPPRFFEAFLRGRLYTEPPDITARICGICPVAYQMSSVHAIESAFGVTVPGTIRELRRLLYCGEWIESHALHIYMLHAPDFLGYEDAIRMAADHAEAVQRGLKLKKTGTDLVALLGGREIHPISVRVGGFYRVPTKKELQSIADKLKWARDAALETVRWTATLPFPEFEQDYEFVALHHPEEYALNEGRLISNKGLDICIQEYDRHFVEEHLPHSNALHSHIVGRGAYFVGPLARFNLNFEQLSPLAQEAARDVGFLPDCRNPFKGIIARAVETLYACDEALRIIENYEMPERPYVEVHPRAGMGYGCTEAPRGILFHRYRFDEKGHILDAKIVPPTAQNQRVMESDLCAVVTKNLELDEDKLTWLCEQTI
ncbi:MAG: Ni/Fe hydrogenase subunit alpha, partial [candidate division KSB1 bacterium]|nr:Ni/Fe hydrogenase subunit alpha [candidate division KSB1 bacterium]